MVFKKMPYTLGLLLKQMNRNIIRNAGVRRLTLDRSTDCHRFPFLQILFWCLVWAPLEEEAICRLGSHCKSTPVRFSVHLDLHVADAGLTLGGPSPRTWRLG